MKAIKFLCVALLAVFMTACGGKEPVEYDPAKTADANLKIQSGSLSLDEDALEELVANLDAGVDKYMPELKACDEMAEGKEKLEAWLKIEENKDIVELQLCCYNMTNEDGDKEAAEKRSAFYQLFNKLLDNLALSARYYEQTGNVQ